MILLPAWAVWLGILLPRIPSQFMQGNVVVSGPSYAQFGDEIEMHTAGSSVSMEEPPVEENVVDDDDGVEEIQLD